jgi:hypothetical protein
MSKFLRYAAVGAAVASFGIASGAQAATTDSANATAKILSSLAVAVDSTADTLDFGSIADSGISGPLTIAVGANGVRGTCPTGLTCSGTTKAPLFHVTGMNTKVVNVSIVNPTETLTYVGTAPTGFASTTMSVSNFVTDATGGQVTLGATGANFSVGGTLTVSADSAPGVYSGTLSVAVAYN